MKKIFNMLFVLIISGGFIVLNPAVAQAKKKRQTIDLEGVDVDGKVRTPTGDYVLQKSGVDFFPLYEKKREMNSEIKKTIHFLR